MEHLQFYEYACWAVVKSLAHAPDRGAWDTVGSDWQ